MNNFAFNYLSNGKSLIVIIKADTINKAMIKFAENYHEIQHIYSILQIP